MNLPKIPNGYRILYEGENVQKGDLWSYYSRLTIHGWLSCRYVENKQLPYNVYIRKIEE